MRTQAAFLMLGLLYLAGTLDKVVNAEVEYEGPESVKNGSAWTISCKGFNGKGDVNWTKNGQTPEELSQGVARVFTNDSISALSTDVGLEHHEGVYKCAKSSNKTFRLIITTDIIYKVVLYGSEYLTKEKFVLKQPLVVQCGNSSDKDVVEWRKNGELIDTKLGTKNEILRFNGSKHILEVLRNDLDVIGNYTCTNKNQSYTLRFRFVPLPVPKFEEEYINVVEGEKLHVVCGGNLYPGVKINWTVNNITFNGTEGRFELSRDLQNGVNNAALTIRNMQLTDSGSVSCRVFYEGNENYNATMKATLKVKDKLAALWPFLGICAEVVVLCAIILIYEKKRNKAELEESDTDQSPDTKPTPNKDSDVRQRK